MTPGLRPVEIAIPWVLLAALACDPPSLPRRQLPTALPWQAEKAVVADRWQPGERRLEVLAPGAERLLELALASGTWLRIEVLAGAAGLDLMLAGDGEIPIRLRLDSTRPETLVHFCRAGGPHVVRLHAARSEVPATFRLEGALLARPEPRDRWLERALRLEARADRSSSGRAAAAAAEAALAQAAADWERLGEASRSAAAYENIAHRYFGLGMAREAAFFFRAAAEARRRTHEVRWEVSDRNFYGLALRRLQDAPGARRQFLRAHDLAAADSFLRGQAAALNNLALLEQDEGRLGTARALYRRALRLLETPRSAALAGDVALYRENLARLLLIEGDLAEAEALLRPGLEEGAGRRVSALGELAWVQLLRHRPRDALTTLDQALALDPERRIRGILLDRRGTALEQLGRLREARDAYYQALAGSEGRPARAAILVNLCRLAALHPDQLAGRPACERARQAASLAGVSLGIRASAHFWRARQLRRAGAPRAALRAAEQAAELVRAQRLGASSPDRRSQFLEDRADYVALAVDLAMELHRAAPEAGFDRRALLAIERWRARTLMEHYRDSRSGDPRRRELKSLRRRLRELGEGADGLGSAAHDALREQIAAAEVAAARDTPEAFRSGPAKLEVLQALLDDDTAVADLMLGRERSFLWILTRRELRSFELPAAGPLERLANDYLELVAEPTHTSRRAALLDSGRRLAGALFGPDCARLRGLPGRLVFVGDGGLAQFPLAALPLDDGTPQDPRFLVERFEVVHLPSLPLLAFLRAQHRKSPPADPALALLGDPWYSAAKAPGTIELRPVAAEELRSGLGALPAAPVGRLPHSARELESIARTWRGKPGDLLRVQGPAANRALVLSGALDRFAIVHFSAHGAFDPSAPANSSLLLSELCPGGSLCEARLAADDFGDLAWRAELVVASACQTGSGRPFRLEGAGGLVRGFFAAGAQRALASLWKVEGEATASLMEVFYRALLVDGRAPGAALRDAQLEMLAAGRRDGKAWRAPYFWGGFVLVGDWRVFSLAEGSR